MLSLYLNYVQTQSQHSSYVLLIIIRLYVRFSFSNLGLLAAEKFSEARGFEPRDVLPPTVFKTAAIDHSAMLPS
jgi:hypothetical protein